MMFASTASGFCDETKDALQPAVAHLQVTSKIQETSIKKCPGSAKIAPTYLGINVTDATQNPVQDIQSLLMLAKNASLQSFPGTKSPHNETHCHGLLIDISFMFSDDFFYPRQVAMTQIGVNLSLQQFFYLA